MEHRYDAVIIGGGPAGTACGIALRMAGADPLIIDRATFPRGKTCAGLVTLKTYKLIQELFGDENIGGLFCMESDHVRLFRRREMLADAPLERPVHLVDRLSFDNALIQRYKALGGAILEGERSISIDHDKKLITLSNGDTVSCDNLLYADGALSMSRRLTGEDKSELAFGIEVYAPRELLPVDSVDLYFGYLDTGYAWVFPHGETVCIGAADRYRKGVDWRAITDGFLRDLGVPTDGLKYTGAFLPYGKAADQAMLPDGVMLLGDAAGLTDPISGEGLYMAMQSGICAAHALSQADPKASYLSAIRPLTDAVSEGRKVQKTFYSPIPHGIFTRKVRGNARIVSYFFENMVEEYRYAYRDMPRLLSDYHRSKKSGK